MSVLLLLLAVLFFLLEALRPLFDWDLGDFHAIAWGLAALSASFLVGTAAFTNWRSRV